MRLICTPTVVRSLQRQRPAFIAVRHFADVQVEHARGQWKTYGNLGAYQPGKHHIRTHDKISSVGLTVFKQDFYDIFTDAEAAKANPHAILLRSYKLKESDVPHTVRAIARCGAGTNNIPVSRMTELGIPVFNTPGANANAVKELILAGLFLGSRRLVDGINHMKQLASQGLAKERVEKDKAMFGGREIAGKRLAVIGLGHIGSATARDAAELGMTLSGYDPGMTVQTALTLPRDMVLKESMIDAVKGADYISLNIPYIKGSPKDSGTHGIIGPDVIAHFKPDAVILNFARGELVDSEAMKAFLDANKGARYISDFPDDLLWNHQNAVILPHLGASTAEAEEAAARMAAETICDYLETGTIRNSVNFPTTFLAKAADGCVRFTVVNRNKPGVLAAITEAFAKEELNIVQQINQSRGDVAYNVLDIDTTSHEEVLCFKQVQERITMLDGVLSSRVLYGVSRGMGFAKNVDGVYFV